MSDHGMLTNAAIVKCAKSRHRDSLIPGTVMTAGGLAVGELGKLNGKLKLLAPYMTATVQGMTKRVAEFTDGATRSVAPEPALARKTTARRTVNPASPRP
ncbi:MAG TPA: hypothetical protein VMV79_01525 [Alphaproteobacteria bacterium]|nr:hypothetical protein [Alphaproteobacteria bacterium]